MTYNPENIETVSDAYDCGGISAVLSLKYALSQETEDIAVADMLAVLDGTIEIITRGALADGRDISGIAPTMADVEALFA